MSESRPHSERYWDARETWPREKLATHQLERLKAQLSYVHANSRFYSERHKRLGWQPGDVKTLDDLRALPVTRKANYVDAVNDAPPWGTQLAAPLDAVVRVHFSSGTTAKPAPDCWTQRDLDRWSDLYARMAYSQGVRKTDVFQCLFSLSWFVGGLGGMASYTKIGATCIPAGSVDSQRQVRTIFDYGTTAVCATPSFAVHLIEVARGMGLDLRDSKVARIALGGEPGAGIPATRSLIERGWNAQAYDAYGSLEFQPIAWECAEKAGSHLAEDFALAEVLDPETEQPVPDGTPGVLVLTHLDKEACPLIRWWTGDVVVRDPSPCACGRTHARLAGGVRGRADDMLIVRGVNVFPSAVEEVVRATPGTTGEYLIVLDKDVSDHAGFLTGIKLRVERAPDSPSNLTVRLTDALRAALQVRAVVEVVEPGVLPRTTHKAKRILREI